MYHPGGEATESHAQSPHAHPKTEENSVLSDDGPHERRISLATIRQGNKEWWAVKDSNLRPTGYEPAALTT